MAEASIERYRIPVWTLPEPSTQSTAARLPRRGSTTRTSLARSGQAGSTTMSRTTIAPASCPAYAAASTDGIGMGRSATCARSPAA